MFFTILNNVFTFTLIMTKEERLITLVKSVILRVVPKTVHTLIILLNKCITKTDLKLDIVLILIILNNAFMEFFVRLFIMKKNLGSIFYTKKKKINTFICLILKQSCVLSTILTTDCIVFMHIINKIFAEKL